MKAYQYKCPALSVGDKVLVRYKQPNGSWCKPFPMTVISAFGPVYQAKTSPDARGVHVLGDSDVTLVMFDNSEWQSALTRFIGEG